MSESDRSYPYSYYGWSCDHCGQEMVWEKATSEGTLKEAQGRWREHRRGCVDPAEERLVRAVAGMLAEGGRGVVHTLSAPKTPDRLETHAEYVARLEGAGMKALKAVGHGGERC